jgi:hypothetical protein
MENQAQPGAEQLLRGAFAVFGQPLMQSWLGQMYPHIAPGPFTPQGSYLDWLEQQEYDRRKQSILQTTVANDPEVMKVIKGIVAMLGHEWSPAMEQQAKTFQGAISTVAPLIMALAPDWWDAMHGSTGSEASLVSAVMDAHRYDPGFTPEKAHAQAQELARTMMSNPHMHRGFSLGQLGGIYREAAKRGLIRTGAPPQFTAEELAPVTDALSAVRDTMGPRGYDTNDISGMFAAVDTVAPKTLYDYGNAAREIRVGNYYQQRGGQYGALMRQGGLTPQTAGVSQAELNRQHQQLLENARTSPYGNLLAATGRAVHNKMVRPDSRAAEIVNRAMAGQPLDNFDPQNWQKMMVESGGDPGVMAHMQGQREANLGFWDRNPQYRDAMVPALRQQQYRLDHKPIFDSIDKQYARYGQAGPELASGAKERLAKAWGFNDLRNYNAIHNPQALMTASNVYNDANRYAQVRQETAYKGQDGPFRRAINSVKGGVPSLGEFGAVTFGGIPKTSADVQAHTPTVAVDLDGTLAKAPKKFDPKKIEAPRPGAKDAMEEFRRKGYRIVINTVRGDTALIKQWLEEHEIAYDHINENPDQPKDSSNKIIADVMIDDRGVDARPAWRRIVEQVVSRLERKKMASDSRECAEIRELLMCKQAIRGIPDRSNFGDPAALGVGEIVDMFLQRHKAQRAGEHYDLRIGTPRHGLLSWATKPTRMPKPGEKKMWKQQPVHSHAYGSFSGSIGTGYGKGEVRSERKDRILITKAEPTKIEFTIASSGTPERFILFKPEKWKDKSWLMINTTPTKPVPYAKVRHKKIPADKVEDLLDKMQEGTSVQAKIDGASSLVKLMRRSAEVLSYRTSKKNDRPIVHTERVFGKRPQLDIPPELAGAVLKGELYGQTADGKVIPPQSLGGMLNATIENSRKAQREKGVTIKNMIYDIQQRGKTPVDPKVTTYPERRKMIEELLPHLPADTFHLAEEATTPAAAKALWRKVLAGKHPLTEEGIVAHPPTGVPMKAKKLEETDVHIKDIFPGRKRLAGTAAGGFGYALEPGGARVGEVGTGLSDELRREMHKDPDAFIGRIARIRAQGQLPSGAWRAPALLALHEDY